MSSQVVTGFVKWFDLNRYEGIISDFDGNEWYFNSWSFALTHYRVTGKCKETGLTKTVSTRCFPGLFLGRKEVKDFRCSRIKSGQPVRFRQADGISQRWAMDISFAPSLKNQVLDYKIFNALEAYYWDSKHRFSEDFLDRRLNELLEKVEAA